MAELKCNDGTVVQISDETETELRKAFEPPHVWKHGDVFTVAPGIHLIYIRPFMSDSQIIYLDDNTRATCCVESYLRDATFLYNIKERL